MARLTHKQKMAESRRLAGYVIAGYADFQAGEPWAHSPMTDQQVDAAGGVESEEQKAYWDGFFGGSEDAMRKVNEGVRHASHS